MTATKPIEGELVTEEQESTAIVHYDPSQLLGMAIEKGLDITTLERLMDLQERWEKNKARAAFFEAKARFQGLVPEIPKLKQGYGYLYAPLGDIERAIGGSLGQCGLSKTWNQIEGNGDITMTCVITHILGHSESSSIGPVKWDLLERTERMNGLQHRAAVISYLHRYTLISALGIATADEDTDGENGKKKREKDPETKIADQIRQPRKINKEQARRITDLVASRGIPSATVTSVIQTFGFAGGVDITVDKLDEIIDALSKWQPSTNGEQDKGELLRTKAENLFLALAQLGRTDEAIEAIEKASGVRALEHVHPGETAAVVAALEKLGKKK
jgi:tetratricopeptide (TPR) repeat protein